MGFGEQPGAQLNDIVRVETCDLVRVPAVALGQLDLELKHPNCAAFLLVGVR